MRVAVIGAGTMGSGIAQVCATAGHDVRLNDAAPEQIERAEGAVRSSLARFVAKGRLDAAAADDVAARIRPVGSIGEAVADAEVVIETVVERLDVKHAVFEEVVAAAPSGALLGTNTSQLSITRIGTALGDDAPRLVGMHFFNPPVLMRLVEIVCGLQTGDDAVERTLDFATGLGKDTVVCRKDSPGFLTSRISAIVRLECLRMLEEGVASPADIDKALRLGLNFPMGPLELGDFNGLDTYLHALDSLCDAHGDRFRPTVGLRNLVAAGRLGRKTGWGIYRYDDDGARVERVSDRTVPPWAPQLSATQLTVSDDGVATVTLDRPEAANARNQRMRDELKALWSGVAADPDIRVVVLTGSGDRFFCAGMDLKEAGAPETPAERRDRLRSSRDIEQLASLPQPTVAAVNGAALGGGCEMALACDIRVIADSAVIGLTELAHGLVPGGGGTQRLPRLVGPALAAELLLTGRRLDGPAAVTAGLASRSVPLDRLAATAAQLAGEIAAHPPRAVRYATELLRKAQDVPLSVGVEAELDALLTLMAERQARA